MFRGDIMSKVIVKASIDNRLKSEVENTLGNLGLTTAEAIRLFFIQIRLQKGIPFEIKIPKLEYNEETKKVIDDALDGKNINYVDSIEQLKKELESDC